MPSSCASAEDEVGDIEDCVLPGVVPRTADRLRAENKYYCITTNLPCLLRVELTTI